MAIIRGQAGTVLVATSVALVSLIVLSIGYIAINIAASTLFGCPAGDSQSVGPDPQLSLIPPGVSCAYELGGDAGLLTVRPSIFPTLLAMTSLAGLFITRRLTRLFDPRRTMSSAHQHGA